MLESNRNEEKGFSENNEYKHNNYYTVSENTDIELLYITFTTYCDPVFSDRSSYFERRNT